MPRKLRYLLYITIFFAAVFATAFRSQPRTEVQTTPVTDISNPDSLWVTGHTNSFPNRDGDHCFQQEKATARGSVTLYLKVYAPFHVDKADIELYNYSKDKKDSVEVNPKISYNGYTAAIALEDSITAPHLGPGPYAAVISASGVLPGSKTQESTTYYASYYYGTFKLRHQECWK